MAGLSTRAASLQTVSSSNLNATQAKHQARKSNLHLQRALASIEKDSFRYQQNFRKPWLGENGAVIWPRARVKVAEVVLSQTFETIMGLVIAANLVFIILETNANAACYQPGRDVDATFCSTQGYSNEWLQIANYALLVIYTAECAARAFVERSGYLWNRWNQIDLATVILGWLGAILTSTLPVNVLRMLRLVRLVRAARVVISVPEFFILVSGLTSSIKAILFGSVLLVCIIVVWSIVVVEILHPVNFDITYPSCDRCSTSYSNVWSAMLTIFQQVVAGDSWGEISIPLVEKEWWTIALLFPIMMTISLGAMNLILAVIVERATEARENDQVRKTQKKELERENNMVHLALLCDKMDEDRSGTLSFEEMVHGFDNNNDFNELMMSVDIMREDMATIFEVMDSNDSGDVDYMDFCQNLVKFRKRDLNIMPSLIKCSIMEVRKIIKRDVLKMLEEQREMLFDQFEILSCLPSCCEKAKEKMQAARRRPKPGLRRAMFDDGIMSSSLGTVKPAGGKFRRHVSGDSAPEPPPTGSWGLDSVEPKVAMPDPQEVLDSLDAACQTFQTLQSQLQPVLKDAEQLTIAWESATKPPKGQRRREDRTTVRDAQNFGQPRHATELEVRCTSVLRQLQERVRVEEQLQERCRNIQRSLKSLVRNPDSRLAVVGDAKF